MSDYNYLTIKIITLKHKTFTLGNKVNSTLDLSITDRP